MDNKKDNLSLDIKAEKQSFSQLLNIEEPEMLQGKINLPRIDSSDLKSLPVETPVIENYNHNFYADNQKHHEVKSNNSLRVEPNVTGVNVSLDVNSIESINGEVVKNTSDIKSLSNGMSKMYNELHGLATKNKESDPYEERPTVLPTNLIFYDRIKRTVNTKGLN